MAKWCDEITLITEVEPQEQYNENGFENPAAEEKRTVFCNKRSVSQGEYYKAQQAGKQVEAKAEVHTVDYAGETLAEFEGKRYSVLKTYEPPDSDIIELTLTDLPTAAETQQDEVDAAETQREGG